MEVNKHMKQKEFYEKMSDWKKQYELKEDKIQTGRFNEYEKRREAQQKENQRQNQYSKIVGEKMNEER